MITIEIVNLTGDYARATHNGAIIVKRSRAPVLTAARKLKKLGYPDETRLQSKRMGSDMICIRTTVGAAARLAVRETNKQGPLLVAYRPPTRGLLLKRSEASENN